MIGSERRAAQRWLASGGVLPLRYLAHGLGLVAIAGLVAAIALAAVRTAPPLPAQIATGSAARSSGILGFEVISEAPGSLDVRLDGPPGGGRLRVRTAPAQPGETEQQIEGFGAPFIVRTRRESLVLGRAGAERIVARRERGAWIGDSLDAGDSAALARVVALDEELAVQGSSLVFGGAAYVQCTVRCLRAEACVRTTANAARCADDVVVCAACLERAP